MTRLIQFSLLILLSLSACDSTEDTHQDNLQNESADTSSSVQPDGMNVLCPVLKKMDQDAVLTIGDEHQVALIKENDKQSLEVYTSDNCQRLGRVELPAQDDAQQPYRLAHLNYNNVYELVGLAGRYDILVYDLPNMEWIGPLRPQAEEGYVATDAQSGMIRRLEVWENYLVGYATDMGPFVFDLNSRKKPVSLTAYAEYGDGVDKSRLYLLQNKEGDYQAIMPTYDLQEDVFQVNPLFPMSVSLTVDETNSTHQQKHLIMKTDTGRVKTYVVDMSARSLVDVPDHLQEKNVQAVEAWLQSRQ